MTHTQSNHTPSGDSQSDGVVLDLVAGRRAFLRNVGLGAAGLAVMGGSVAASGKASAQAAITDADILNFALNLEYLEAEFYLRAAFGRGLADADITGSGTVGAVAGGRQVTFATRNIRLYAEEIANDEEAHVKFLRSALGDSRVARPRINLNTSFTAAARAAGLIPADGTFDPYANEANFLLAAFIFEDVGVTAYKGAAPLITNKGTLEAAAGLLSVEAYHAGIVRTVLFGLGLFSECNKISLLRDSVDGNGNNDQNIGNSGGANLVPTDANGLTYSRSPAQVANIVYLGGGVRGGFFPASTNGKL